MSLLSFLVISPIVSISKKTNPTNETNFKCLIQAQEVFSKLNISWFLTFGSALFYHRSRTFSTHDIDTAMFYDQMLMVDHRIESSFLEHQFTLISKAGSVDFGREWSFHCPATTIRFDIFTFYPALNEDRNSSTTFNWWVATYDGLCNYRKYKRCRWHYLALDLESIHLGNYTFNILNKQFLIDSYGDSWTIPQEFTYLESLEFLPNMINE